MIRIVQIACVIALVGVLYAFNALTDGIGRLLGNTFDAGFIVGGLSVIIVYGLICWVDPSSRPRGPSADK